MENLTDIKQSIEENLALQLQLLQGTGYYPDISLINNNIFSLKDTAGQTVLECRVADSHFVFSKAAVPAYIMDKAAEYFTAAIAREHIARETEKIMDEGIENMQANGGRSKAAMEAGYGYEQANNIPPETEETEEESFGFENFTEEALLHLAEISPEAYESLKKEYEQRTGLPADEYLKKSGDKDRQEKEESHIAQRLKSLLENQEMTVQESPVHQWRENSPGSNSVECCQCLGSKCRPNHRKRISVYSGRGDSLGYFHFILWR